MDQLVECVLAVCTRFAPNNWAGVEVDAFAGLGNTFAVTLHVALLEVGGKTVHVLVVGQQGMRLSAKEVGIPNAKQGQNDRRLCVAMQIVSLSK